MLKARWYIKYQPFEPRINFPHISILHCPPDYLSLTRPFQSNIVSQPIPRTTKTSFIYFFYSFKVRILLNLLNEENLLLKILISIPVLVLEYSTVLITASLSSSPAHHSAHFRNSSVVTSVNCVRITAAYRASTTTQRRRLAIISLNSGGMFSELLALLSNSWLGVVASRVSWLLPPSTSSIEHVVRSP